MAFKRGKLSDLIPTETARPAPQGGLRPVPLALDLFDFQQEALRHALRDTSLNGHSLLALDMGLGKTPCGIAVAAAAAAEGLKTLVVVPPSLRINWEREFAKFAPTLTTAVLQGTKPYGIPDTDVTIIGDSQIATWHATLTGYGALVVDESHRFKNWTAKRTKALAKIATQCGNVRVLLTGTPIPNGRHVELAGQLTVLGDSAWNDIGGKGAFWNKYAPKIDSWGGRGNRNSAELHQRLTSTFMIRMKRDEVIDLPNKGRSIVTLEGVGPAVKDYIKIEEDLIRWLREEGENVQGALRAEALVKLNKLRMKAGEIKVRPVVEHVSDILDNAPGGVFLVAEHRDTIDELVTRLQKYNPTYVMGGMKDEEKQDSVDAFNSGKSRVLVGQITAAGVGLTLHGDGKNHRVVIAQLPWTPADLRQAEDRLHRIGQTHDVEVEIMLSSISGHVTIDERLWGALEDKHFQTSEVIDGEGDELVGAVADSVLSSYRG